MGESEDGQTDVGTRGTRRSDGRGLQENEKRDTAGKDAGTETSEGLSPRQRRTFLKRHILVAERLGRGRDAEVRVYSRKSGGNDRKVRGIKSRKRFLVR